ncbi:MAG: TIGR04283 family arsenosugar biosynthesis glycosyltransferase [Flavobacteriaceae bacterium]|nr:TIGR04283 family arsenosugar biosynthesis glycosyltransferase [Flavobacteriaceae bacterium]
MKRKISIIIPILNEADTIQSLLSHLIDNSKSYNISEIIIVDGGSTDGSMEIVQRFIQHKDKNSPNVLSLQGARGRAKQMNQGASAANGDILYFLHADSFPPKNFDSYIINEVEKGNHAGCFRMRFDDNHWWLKLAGWLTQFNVRACRGGDQSQFITKKLFNEIGGYDEDFIIYEDNILINELYARKEFVVIPQTLTTSARLYREKGIWRLQYHFWMIYLKRIFGASADELYKYYRKNISGNPRPILDKA